LISLGVIASENVGDRFLSERYWFYQRLQALDWRRPAPSVTRIVLIRDAEFWSPSLAGRTPLDRAYLASLLDAVARQHPTVIALDVRLPALRPGTDYSVYTAEDNKLLDSIQAAAKTSRIVLPADLEYDLSGRGWRAAPTIYAGRLKPSPRITRGYLELIPDVRTLPLRFQLEKHDPLDSFSQAIVRGYNLLGMVDRWTSDHPPFASFRSKDDFAKNILVASSVISAPADSSDLYGTIVLIGGAWSALAPRKGQPVDTRPTPAGPLPGVFIHANYVESYLGHGLFQRLPPFFEGAVEILVSLALVTALVWRRHRFRGKIYPVLLLSLLLLLFSYVLMMNLGFYFDFVVPVTIVFLHWTYHQVKEWRDKAAFWDHDHPDPM
jgi:CHASE2 domain-containing sensor protein